MHTSNAPAPDNNNYNLIGPRSDERESTPNAFEVRLKDGSPLYHALLKDPNAIMVRPGEAQEAKAILGEKIETDEATVLLCQGKTATEARRILESIRRAA